MAKELKIRWIILAAGIALYAGAVALARLTAFDNEVKFWIFLPYIWWQDLSPSGDFRKMSCRKKF